MTTQVGFPEKLLAAAGGVALVILGLFAGSGIAAAAPTELDATPMPPAVIDEDGTHNYDTSTYPAQPSWPAPSTYPAPSTWPGESSHPCCSR